MVDRDHLITYLDDLLQSNSVKDYAPNGLQVSGKHQINKICTAVSAGSAILDQAVAADADLLLVHHGYFWKGEPNTVLGIRQKRLKTLLANDLNLCAYHLPLDIHLELGNNAALAKLLQVEGIEAHAVQGVNNLLWSGNFVDSISPSALSDFLEQKLQKPLHLTADKKSIYKIAWCSGAAQDFIEQAALLGVDAYISGEVSERTFYLAKELNVHYFACGHHATERYGIQALGDHICELFAIEHTFLDIENPV